MEGGAFQRQEEHEQECGGKEGRSMNREGKEVLDGGFLNVFIDV